MCDSPMSVPAGRRSLPDSVCALLGRSGWPLLLAVCLLAGLSFPAAAQTQVSTLAVSPTTSTDGSYTLTWGAPASSSISTRLHERVGSGSWSVVGTYRSTVTSKSYTGKAAGTYGYKTEQCGTFFGSTTCWDAAGPVSVTVSTGPTPKPTASISWTPAKITVGQSATLTWGSTHATACYLNTNKRAASGSWTTSAQTRTRTDKLYCTGDGGTSPTVSATLTVMPKPVSPPAAPAKPALTGGAGQFTAAWTAPSDNGNAITEYEVAYRRSGVTAWTSKAIAAPTTRATVTGLAAGTYTVRVRAENGGGWSGYSATATVVVTVAIATPVLTISPATSKDGSYTVDWDVPRCYRVFRAQVCRTLQERLGTGAWTAVAGISATATSKAFTGKAAGTWQYRMLLGTQVLAGPESVVVSPPSPPATPATPTGPAASAGAHTVSWTAVSRATGYRLRARKDSGTWTEHALQSTRSKAFSGLAAGEWDYQVKACNGGGCSGWSGTLTITVSAPTTLTVTPVTSTDGAYTVRWPAPALTIIKVRLWQQVEKNGKKAAWTVVGTYAGATTSKSFSQGSAPAVYYHKAEHCITVFGTQTCWGESATVSVTVQAPVMPATPTGLASTTADAGGDYTVREPL